MCWEFYATDEKIFYRQKEEKTKTPRDKHGTPSQTLSTRASHGITPLGAQRQLTKRQPPMFARLVPNSSRPTTRKPQDFGAIFDGTRSTSSHGMRVIIGFSGLTRRGHRTPSPALSLATPSANLFHRGYSRHEVFTT